MTVDDLIKICVNLTVRSGFTTEDGSCDMTNALLELQICLEQMDESVRFEVDNILNNLK